MLLLGFFKVMFILYLIIMFWSGFFFFWEKNVPLSAIEKYFSFLNFLLWKKLNIFRSIEKPHPALTSTSTGLASLVDTPHSHDFEANSGYYIISFVSRWESHPPPLCSVVSKIEFMFITDFVELQKLVHLHHIQLSHFWNKYLNIVLISKSNFIWVLTSESSFI